MKKLLFLFLCAIAYTQPLIVSMNAGELAPLVKYRVDLQQYSSGCQTLENMIVLPQGAAMRRPGTEYIAATKSNGYARLIPFEYSTTDTYIIEAGTGYLRFYRNGGQILDGASAYEISTEFTQDQLDDLQFVQNNDVMYISHPDVHPQKLLRYGHTSWTIADVDFKNGPFLDENTSSVTITPGATTGYIILTASSALFDSSHVGSLWRISHIVGTSFLPYNRTGSNTGISDTRYLEKGRKWEFSTAGTWNGTVELEKSYDGGVTWLDEYIVTSVNNDNRHETGIVDTNDAYYRINVSSHVEGNIYTKFYALSDKHDGVVQIGSVTNSTSAYAQVIETLSDTNATTLWAEGAWSDYRGYPRAVGYYEQRIVYAGTSYEPTKIWASKVFEYENFDVGEALDDEAVVYDISIAKQNPILWVTDLDTLLVGTNGALFKWGVLDGSKGLTPANSSTKRLTKYPAAAIQPVSLGESTLFVERGGRKLQELAYSLEVDGYTSNDLTLLASHITDPCIVQVATMTRPYPIVWCLRSDGVIAGLSYQKRQGVIAWHRFVTDGTIESIATIPGADEDELWMSVNRTIDDSTVRYIERMKPFDWGDDDENIWFVDSGLEYDGTAATTITGLDHLEGETVDCFADGYYEQATVADGSITLSQSVTHANIGLPYTSTLTTMPLEAQINNSYTIGKLKDITDVFIAYLNSMEFEYSATGGSYWRVRMGEQDNEFTGEAPSPQSGYAPASKINMSSTREASLTLRQTKPYPMEILAIYPQIEYEN